ncbi:MAG: hydrogenase formation protein HypD [Methanimicrococcus sp.]|nr:hydrogenase formation protein HypD [Methanimicrococcus sp.]
MTKENSFVNNPVEVQKKLIETISSYPKPVRIMHICGTHERTIAKYGIRSLLPERIEVLSGPGCPVCVTPDDDIDTAILLAKKGFTVITFGDMLRVPGTEESLFDARAEGADVRMVYSIDNAVKIAEENPDKEIVFFSIGFETTIPTTAAAVLRGLPSNFSIYASLKLTPPAINLLVQDINVDAFIAPGHVAVITGTVPYEEFAKKGYPIAVAGFESYDILLGIKMLLDQMSAGKNEVENAYMRAVKTNGNPIAVKMMNNVFDIVDVEWRGLGIIPLSGYKLKEQYKEHDAAAKYKEFYEKDLDALREIRKKKKKNCICATILTGKATPSDCPMFGTACKPTAPIGPCMVSDEGMCHSWYKYCRD